MGHENFGYVFTVCDNAEKNCPRVFLTQGQHHHWSFEDPAAANGSDEAQLAKFREVRDLIERQVQDWVGENRRKTASP